MFFLLFTTGSRKGYKKRRVRKEVVFQTKTICELCDRLGVLCVNLIFHPNTQRKLSFVSSRLCVQNHINVSLPAHANAPSFCVAEILEYFLRIL